MTYCTNYAIIFLLQYRAEFISKVTLIVKKRTLYLKDKLILMFLSLLVLPLILFGTLLFKIQKDVTTSFIQQNLSSSVAQQADRLSQELYMVKSLGNLFYLDDSVISALSAENGPDVEQLTQLSSKYTPCLGKLHATVAFLTADGQYCGGIPADFQPDPDRLNDFIDPSSNYTTWLTSYDLFSVEPSSVAIYAVRPLHDRTTWEQVGTLVISVPEHELRKICSGYLTENQNAYLLDLNGNLLCEVNNQNIPFKPKQLSFPQYTGSYYEREADQLINYYTESNAKWVLAVASNQKAILKPYRSSSQLFVGLLIIYFGVTVVLSFIFAKRLVRPIHELQKNIDLVKQGNLDTMVPVTSSDEIGQLSEQYNEMLCRIRDLLNGLMETQQAQHDAEMLALQAQINPHFIYNALASIRFLVFSDKKAETDRALLSLVNILHGTLSNPHDLSTIGQEIKLLKDYIDLQCISFSHPLSVTFDVDEEIRNCSICKLTLQPIVENAFIHGFDSESSDCALNISAKAVDDRIEITITDNGVGFDPSVKAKKATSVNGTPHTGLGIENVHERIKLAFGPEYGLRIESVPGKGTTVHVTIPIKQEKGDIMIYDSFNC